MEKHMEYTLNPKGKQNILDLLKESGVPVSALCGGTGRCGKCAVRIITGHVDISPRDAEFFSEQELEAGWRLACTSQISEATVLELPDNGRMEILDSFTLPEAHKKSGAALDSSKIYIAVDLGTTTIAVVFYGSDGRRLGSRSFMNPQCTYGADVITRLKYSVEAGGKRLSDAVRKGIANCIRSFNSLPKDFDSVSIVLAGNTIMVHLFLGLDCSGMAQYPFRPQTLELRKQDAEGIFGELWPGRPVSSTLTVFPGASSFIGGDIIAGMYALNFDCYFDKTNINKTAGLLVDLGTNGEIVLACPGRLVATSTAAGPVFEGGNISCGMACIDGAIDHLQNTPPSRSEAEMPVCHVMGENAPEGLCGSGVLELTDWLLSHNIIDSEGAFTDPGMKAFCFAYDCNGAPLCLTQADIRELQTAKAAIRAGIDILSADSSSAPASYPSVPSVLYLAGGMGSGLYPEKIHRIGLFPENLRILPVGNSCLAGLDKYIAECVSGNIENAEKTLRFLAQNTSCIDMASDEGFASAFIGNMKFRQ